MIVIRDVTQTTSVSATAASAAVEIRDKSVYCRDVECGLCSRSRRDFIDYRSQKKNTYGCYSSYAIATMSLPFSGSKSKSAGLVSAIRKQTLLLNLKPVKKVSVKFDPFSQNAATARNFVYYLLSPKVIKTNPLCLVRNEVVNDRSESTVDVSLVNGESVLFKCQNLTVLEIFQQFNKHITPLAPKEEVTEILVTKTDKKKGGKR